LYGALGAAGQELNVFDGGHAVASGVVVGVLGVGRHHGDERVAGDVVSAQHVTSLSRGGGQDSGDPVRTGTPG
jgi:hypothetical protein